MHQTNSRKNLTFRKSNYKYKRREIPTMRALPVKTEARKPNQLSLSTSESAATTRTKRRRTTTTTGQEFSTILSLFIVIVWRQLQQQYHNNNNNNKQPKLFKYNAARQIIDDRNNDVNSTSTSTIIVTATTTTSIWTELRHQQAMTVTKTARTTDTDDTNDEVSTTTCEQHQQQQQLHHLSSSSLQRSNSNSSSKSVPRSSPQFPSSMAAKTPSMAFMKRGPNKFNLPLSMRSCYSTLMTLLLAVTLSSRLASAGTCWQTAVGGGKCSQIFSTNITKTECCDSSQTFSYTDRELSAVEYFFASAIGGGVECAPCLESCKNFKCGPNKKCVKRKGRPKCVCAPECGAALRRKQQPKLLMLRGKSPRDSRSLSSEIININSDLDEPQHHYHHHKLRDNNQQQQQQQQQKQHQQHGRVNSNNDNQRKQQQQETLTRRNQEMPTPRSGDGHRRLQGETKHRRLLIIDSSNLQQKAQPTSRRRLHMKSSSSSNNNNSNSNNSNININSRGAMKTELTVYAGYEHRRYRNNTSTKHLTRSMTTTIATTTTTTAAAGANDSSTAPTRNVTAEVQSQSRHKLANANEPTTTTTITGNSRQTSRQQNNGNMVRTRVRHMHQQQYIQQQHQQQPPAHARRIEADPNHDYGDHNSEHKDRQRQHRRQRQKKEKEKEKEKQRQPKHRKPKDRQAIATVAIATTTIAIATINGNGSSSSSSSTLSGPRQRLHGVEHGNEMATSSVESELGSGWGHVKSHFSNADDLAFSPGIYDHSVQQQQQQQQQHSVALLQQQHHTNPVCGSDGRTYNTECQLRKRACRTNNAQLELAYRGHCKTSCNGIKCVNGFTCVEDQYMMPHCISCNIECPWPEMGEHDLDGDGHPDDGWDAERAVCGVDGKTYRSTCDINRMICKIGRSIAVAYPGPCRADRVTCADLKCGPKDTCLIDLQSHTPRCVSCRYKCSRKHLSQMIGQVSVGKICGINNRTYNSWCEMRKDSCSTGFFIGIKMVGACN